MRTQSNVKRCEIAPLARPFLVRLRQDKAGNTLMLVAAAIIPLTAMIGAGVDISRTYMIKSRLQQACDAGALAVRKSMGGSSSISSQAATNGQTFFKNNFPSGAFGTSNINFAAGLDANSQIAASASATVPETIMTVFGNDHTDISVTCSAKLEVANTDVMFVLDTTGSMADCPDDSNCGGGAGSKIVGLRSAVLDFFDTVNAAKTATSQLRFGFMPYSMSVNVGDSLPSSDMVDSHTYQSAVANMTTPYYQANAGTPAITVETYSSTLSATGCNRYGSNRNYPTLDGSTFNSGGPQPSPTTVTKYTFKDWGATGTMTGTNRTCRRNKTVTTTTYTLAGYSLTDWTFKPVSYDVSGFKSGNSISLATSDPSGYMPTSGSYNLEQLAAAPTAGTSNSSVSWNKCIEERDTVTQATYGTIPNGAYDLQIDTLPTSQETRWRPSFVDAVRDRSGTSNETATTLDSHGTTYTVCPVAASKLAAMARADVQTYVNSLQPNGYTYHDVGMAWGARFISPTGIFASENAVAANGRPISRHIIFMTDGLMCPVASAYSFQGYEKLDRRVMGSTTPSDCSGEIITRHTNRFLALCSAAKSMNISVWTVAFGTQNPASLVSCANANQAFVATDTATLRSQFQQIAARIAALRLSQ
jgi:Flp pilus assembly protein TadG